MHQIEKQLHEGYEQVHLSNERYSIRILVNVGNTLISFTRDGREWLYFPFTASDYAASSRLAGNPFMHPWANRLAGDYLQTADGRHNFPDYTRHIIYRDGNGLPLHGLLQKTDAWETTALEVSEQHCHHTALLHFDDPEMLAVFPYRHSLEMTHRLTDDGLEIIVEVTNHEPFAMPLSFGFHPYFLKTEDAVLVLPAEQVLDVDSQMIPTGNARPKSTLWEFRGDELLEKNAALDHGFTGLKPDAQDIVSFHSGELAIWMKSPYSYVQVYMPPAPDKPYVCIEPMLAPTNALNTSQCPMLEARSSCKVVFGIR